MKYSVIQHPTRGWYTGSEYEPAKTGYAWVSHFAYSVASTDDRVEKMFSQAEIDCEMGKIPENIRAKCTIVAVTI